MLRHALLVVSALAMVVAGAAHAVAQTCSGLPAIGENSKGNIGANLGISSATVGIGANVTLGSYHSFGTFEIGKTNYTEFEFTRTIVGLTLGGQFDLGRTRPISICPVVNGSGEWASDLNSAGLSYSTDLITGGGHVGFILYTNNRRDIVPTLGLTMGRLRDTLAIPGQRETQKDTISVLTLGVGFVFDKRLAIRPAVIKRFGVQGVPGLPGSPATVSVIGTFAFGHR